MFLHFRSNFNLKLVARTIFVKASLVINLLVIIKNGKPNNRTEDNMKILW